MSQSNIFKRGWTTGLYEQIHYTKDYPNGTQARIIRTGMGKYILTMSRDLIHFLGDGKSIVVPKDLSSVVQVETMVSAHAVAHANFAITLTRELMNVEDAITAADDLAELFEGLF